MVATRATGPARLAEEWVRYPARRRRAPPNNMPATGHEGNRARALIVLVAVETGELAERGRIGVARGTVGPFPGVLAGKDGEELAVVAGETIGRVAVAAMLH